MVADPDGRLKKRILAYADQQKGAPLRAADLLHLGSRASIDQALSRLAKAGTFARSGRGAYVRTTTKAAKTAAASRPSKRDFVIDAAAQLFAARGYYGVSMRDIAAPSGLHIATLYHYFPDKRALYEAVVRAAWEEGARHTLQAEDPNAPARQQLEAWISNVLEFHFMQSTSARIRDRELFLGDDTSPGARSDMLAASARGGDVVHSLITRLSPPILRHMSADRIGEIIYSLAYGVIKFMPAYAVLHEERTDMDFEAIKADVLRFIGTALGWTDAEI